MPNVSMNIIGGVKRIEVDFRDSDSNLVDPASSVIFTMREPDGTVTAYTYGVDAELVRDAVGEYHVDWTISQVGIHTYKWIGESGKYSPSTDAFYAANDDV